MQSTGFPYLNIGSYVVLHKLIQEFELKEILGEYMDDKETGGYRKLGFILDRGYFSRKNLAYMEQLSSGFYMKVIQHLS